MSAVRAPMLALGSLQGRDSPANGRLRAGRRPSRPHSGPLRAFQVPGHTPGYPLKQPSTPVPGAVGSPAITTPTPVCLAGSVRTASNTDVLARAATPRGLAEPASEPPVAFEDCSGRSGSVSAVRAPMLALRSLQGRDSPANGRLRAGRRPSRPHSGPLRAFQVPGCTPGYPLKQPSTPVPGAAGSPAAATSPRTSVPLLGGRQAPSKPGAQTTSLRQGAHHPGHILTDTRSPNSALRGPLTDRVFQVQRSSQEEPDLSSYLSTKTGQLHSAPICPASRARGNSHPG